MTPFYPTQAGKSQAFERAIEALRKHDWKAAHVIAQAYENDPVGDHLHALVHRIEGDLANARYWYNKARERFEPAASVEAELQRIETKLATMPPSDEIPRPT